MQKKTERQYGKVYGSNVNDDGKNYTTTNSKRHKRLQKQPGSKEKISRIDGILGDTVKRHRVEEKHRKYTSAFVHKDEHAKITV